MMEKLTSTTGILIGSIVLGVLAIVGFAVLLDDTSRPWELEYAEELGLDLDQFQADLENEDVIARVDADVEEADLRGVNATPSIFVNGEYMNFQFDIDSELRNKLEEELVKAPEELVLVEEFADFQCPACGSAFPILEQIKIDYEGRAEVIFRHFPLESIHPFARAAAIASEAAREQGKFDEMHDLLFLNQADLTNPDFSDDQATEESDTSSEEESSDETTDEQTVEQTTENSEQE